MDRNGIIFNDENARRQHWKNLRRKILMFPLEALGLAPLDYQLFLSLQNSFHGIH